MRALIPAVILATSLFSGSTFAEPGYYWEFGMQMEGLPFAMPKQKICAPKDSKEPPVTREDDECKVLEKKLTGNRYQWKAQCKDGLMVGDITSTPTSYSGNMKMTMSSGETMSMKMSGKRLGACDYKDLTGAVAALQKKSDEALGNFCQNALDTMQVKGMASQCPKEHKLFCKKIATPEGYDKATRHLPAEVLADPASGGPALLSECKLDPGKSLAKMCASSATKPDFNFVSRFCPAEQPKLCAKAASDSQLDFVSVHCAQEKAELIKAHCEGRRNTSDIEPRFANFCANSAMASDTPQADSSGSESPSITESAEAIATEKIQKGIKQLRGLFGF